MAYNVEVYPNPSSSQVAVKLKDLSETYKEDKLKKNIQVISLSEIMEIRVVDKAGNLKKLQKYGKGNKQVTLNVYDLPSDVYYLEVSDGNKRARIPVVVNR